MIDAATHNKLFRDIEEARTRLYSAHWEDLLDTLIAEFPTSVKFTSEGSRDPDGQLRCKITAVIDDIGVNILGLRDTAPEPTPCAWCDEADIEDYMFRGHDAECPFGAQRGERIDGEWDSDTLDDTVGDSLETMSSIMPELWEGTQNFDITRPWQYVKLVAVLRLRRTFDPYEDLQELLPAENRFGEVMFACADPGYDGEFDAMGAEPSSWISLDAADTNKGDS